MVHCSIINKPVGRHKGVLPDIQDISNHEWRIQSQSQASMFSELRAGVPRRRLGGERKSAEGHSYELNAKTQLRHLARVLDANRPERIK